MNVDVQSSAVNCIVHSFSIPSFSEDPEMDATDSFFAWKLSDAGSWVLKNSVGPPAYLIYKETHDDIYECRIRATFMPEKYVIWKLKYE